MKIKRIVAIPVAIPVKRVGYFSRARRTAALRTIVKIDCDNGIQGIGETRGIHAASIINDKFAVLLKDKEITGPASIRLLCLPETADYGYPDQLVEQSAYAAVDMAIFDCMGKDLNTPLYNLIGGKCRDMARFVAYEYSNDPKESLSNNEIPTYMAKKMLAAQDSTGSKFVEFKVGTNSVMTDIKTVAEVRMALGADSKIGVDANMTWDFDTAEKFIRETLPYNLANIEEPVSDLNSMNKLAKRHSVNISSHCTSADLLTHYKYIDGAVGEPHAEGSVLGCRDLSERLSAIGKRYWFRSVWEAGVSWSAMCHMSVSFPSLRRPMQALINHLKDDLIEEEDYEMLNGGIDVPDRPGLGVTLDNKAVEKFRTDKGSHPI